MFREEYAKWIERAPLSPEFSEKLAQRAVERHRSAQSARPRRAVLALAVILAALLLAGAALAAAKLGMLGKIFEELGADEEAVARVQDVGVEGGGEILRAAFGDAIWEGDDLYVSFTASVPDDGNTYLLALTPPMRDGKMVDFSSALYLYYDLPIVFALGGDGPTEVNRVLDLFSGDADREEPFELALEAALFRTDKEVVGVPFDTYLKQILKEYSFGEGRGAYGVRLQPEDDDRLYYTTPEGEQFSEAARAIDLGDRWDVDGYIRRKMAEFRGVDPSKPSPTRPALFIDPEDVVVTYDNFLIGAEMLEELGIGERVDGAKLQAAIYPGDGAKKVAKDVEIAGNGFTARITSFEMTHLGLRFSAEIYGKDGAAFDGLMPALPDGRPLFPSGPEFGARCGGCVSGDGASGMKYEYEYREIFPTIPETMLLVPVWFDGENTERCVDGAFELALIDG